MNEPQKVYGAECLDYIDRKIGFAWHGWAGANLASINTYLMDSLSEVKKDSGDSISAKNFKRETSLIRWYHDTSKRKIGLVIGKSAEGGLEVALLGNEDIINGGRNPSAPDAPKGQCDYTIVTFYEALTIPYTWNIINQKYERKYKPSTFPNCRQGSVSGADGVPDFSIEYNKSLIDFATFDESMNFIPRFTYTSFRDSFGTPWEYAGNETQQDTDYTITNNKSNTMVFGVRYYNVREYPSDYLTDPLALVAGDLYSYAKENAFGFSPLFPPTMDPDQFNSYSIPYKYDADPDLETKGCNLTSIPYNIILTYDENEAKRYLQDGTLPSDAFLYPLDFDNLPKYEPDDSETGDEPDDSGDIDGSEDEWDIDNDLPEVPSYTPSMLNNNNVYLMTPGELDGIINWFWNDVGDVTDLSDLVTKIEGLTSDLGSNFLMFRIMPVDPSWIGGSSSVSNFIVGPVEKAGTYTALGRSAPIIRDIGHIKIDEKFTSYKFLNYTPYSDAKLYLPYHGIVDLDLQIFQGHTLYVKAVYDYMNGLVNYFIYCDNAWLVGSYQAKMAVDLPITLQSKNDRDSAIFSNVSSSVAGLIGAGTSLATGNPIGLVLGANAIMKQGQAAPMKVTGSVGDTGAFYAPQKCKIIIRRPKIRKPDNYNDICGRQSFSQYRLSSLKGKGYTKVFNPKLSFTKTKPYAEEITEIYDLLTQGVIL